MVLIPPSEGAGIFDMPRLRSIVVSYLELLNPGSSIVTGSCHESDLDTTGDARDPAVRRSEKRSLGGLPNMSKTRLPVTRCVFHALLTVYFPLAVPATYPSGNYYFAMPGSFINASLCPLHFSVSSPFPLHVSPRLLHARIRRPSQSSEPTGPVSGVLRRSQCTRHFSACCRQHTLPSLQFD